MLLTDSMARAVAGAAADRAVAVLTRALDRRLAGCVAGASGLSRSEFLPAIARRDLLLRGVLARGLLDHLAHHLAIAGHERRDLLETVAGPLLELDHAGAFVVGAAGLDRREQSARADLLDPRLGEVQVLEAPAQLLGRHHLSLAELRLRDAKRLDHDHPVDDAARIHDIAQPRRILEIALAGAVDLLLDVLHHREVGTARGE